MDIRGLYVTQNCWSIKNEYQTITTTIYALYLVWYKCVSPVVVTGGQLKYYSHNGDDGNVDDSNKNKH